MPPSMYSAMMGSISSPILNSTTRGRAVEFGARLVCACAGSPDGQKTPQKKISAKIEEPRRSPLAIPECEAKCGSEDTRRRSPENDPSEKGGFTTRYDEKEAREGIRKKE